MESASFSLRDWRSWKQGSDSFAPVRFRSKNTDFGTGEETIERFDEEHVTSIDEAAFLSALMALQAHDSKLLIPVDRWKRSIQRNSRPEDSFIELRIALEALYLKNTDKYRSELGFRLSLFGAWHLGSNPDERRSIRKILLEAYGEASGAVHGGKVTEKTNELLSEAQDLCRRGILNFIREGDRPNNYWIDLILGAEIMTSMSTIERKIKTEWWDVGHFS